ncbi:MAG: O-antigen ligase family protein [Lachnospiraceae bacterium]|nr:O-antigen ligase family protein [Lachnospiraceae bacterium]
MTDYRGRYFSRVYNSRWFLLVALLLIYRPYYFYQISFTASLWDVGRVFLAAFLVISYIARGRYSKLLLFELAIWGWHNVYSLYLDAWSFNAFIELCLIVMITILVELSERNIAKFIDSLRILLAIYLTANIVTILLGFDEKNLFLGFDNDTIMTLLPMVGVMTWGTLYVQGKLKKIDYYIYILLFINFFMTMAATAIVSLLIYIFVLLLMRKNWGISVRGGQKEGITKLFTSGKGIMISIIIWIAIFFFQIQKLFAPLIVYLLHKDLTLTARTLIWERVLSTIRQHPLLGYGYYNNNAEYLLNFRYRASCPHNIMLHFVVSGGILGLIAVIMLYNYAFRNVNKRCDIFPNYVLLAASFAFLICGMTSSFYPMESMFLMLAVANISLHIECLNKDKLILLGMEKKE